MAKQRYGINDAYRGTVGTVIGYEWRGKWCLRSRPSHVHNPRTEKQQANRTLFRQMVDLAGSMKTALRKGLRHVSLGMHVTECNLFLKRNKGRFSLDADGKLSVDWEQLIVSEGELPAPLFVTPTPTPTCREGMATQAKGMTLQNDNVMRQPVPSLQGGVATQAKGMTLQNDNVMRQPVPSLHFVTPTPTPPCREGMATQAKGMTLQNDNVMRQPVPSLHFVTPTPTPPCREGMATQAKGMTLQNDNVIRQPVPSLQGGVAQSAGVGTTATFSFLPHAEGVQACGGDEVYVYAYCPEMGEGVLSAPAYRRTGVVTLTLPERWQGKEAVFYGFAVDYEGTASESVYIGRSDLGVVGLEDDEPVVAADGETVGQGGVERSLPPAVHTEVVQGVLQPLATDGDIGVHGEERDLLAREAVEGMRATHRAEAAVVGEHLEVDAGVLLGESHQVGDIAEGVVLALAGST